ncbi:hypothetical protein KSP39_PZI015911 [Platanthera zijinensis]|uniref:DUF4216 domain-containing protein n=1 Tax=Platanthera zijinensis TaxID=2320716 RepID=A0AAP0BA67_9ASPA
MIVFHFQQISKLYYEGDSSVSTEFLQLARGPKRGAIHYPGYIVNGFRFHTYEREIRRKTQNSGVLVKGDDQSGGREYYGVLKDIIQLEYGVGQKVVLFKCDWWDTYNEGRGYKKESNGVISVNIKHNLRSNEPYVLSSQVEQVYYVPDNKSKDWRVVIKTVSRHFYNVPSKDFEELTDDEIKLYDIDNVPSKVLDIAIDNDNPEFSLQRTDVEAITIEKRTQFSQRRVMHDEE